MLPPHLEEIKTFLDEKYFLYNNPKFIETDPISIPHQFTKKEDIEISGFLAASISWGQRKSIINNATKLMNMMDKKPYDFILNHSEKDLTQFRGFVHRTFNGTDCIFFIQALKYIYNHLGGLENVITTTYFKNHSMRNAINELRNAFLKTKHETRSEKHLPNISKGSAGKRLNMYFRWMIRQDNHGVDFGIWKKIKSKDLYLPLDVHTGNIARKLNLLQRKQNDWKAVEEITSILKMMDENDPVKYDFALFGLGAFENF